MQVAVLQFDDSQPWGGTVVIGFKRFRPNLLSRNLKSLDREAYIFPIVFYI